MNIYVGNLSRDVSETDLREAFQAFGEVATASVIKDKYTGESRGFGFVEMPNKAEADAAISGLNGKDLKGRSRHRVYMTTTLKSFLSRDFLQNL
jgi:RNA recognition motif-containing protein